MKLTQFINNLLTLDALGYGEKEVYYRHGASGDCGELSYPHISSEVSECGPFDLKDGQEYIAIYAGN